MENNTNQLSSNLCKKNCGFFGNPAFDGYCSKCYKEHVKRQNSGTAAGRVTPTSISSVNSESQINPPEIITTTTKATSTVQMDTTPTPTTTIIETNVVETNTSNAVTFNLISSNNDNNSISSNNNLEAMNVDTIAASPSINVNNNNVNATIATNNNNNVELNTSSNDLPEVASSSSVSSMETDNSNNNGNKKKRTRCNVDTCRRKLGLTGFDCRCGNVYCWEHRYSDKHSCQFDYKELGQEQIRKNNPVVVGEKIQKI